MRTKIIAKSGNDILSKAVAMHAVFVLLTIEFICSCVIYSKAFIYLLVIIFRLKLNISLSYLYYLEKKKLSQKLWIRNKTIEKLRRSGRLIILWYSQCYCHF